MSTYRIVYEIENEDLTEMVQQTNPNAKAVFESYNRLVEASSVWQALVVLGASLREDASLISGEDEAGVAYAAPFTVVDVSPCRWSSTMRAWTVGHDEKLTPGKDRYGNREI